jgi:TPR repeat protein
MTDTTQHNPNEPRPMTGDELFQEGYKLYERGGSEELIKAFSLFQQAAALGNADATYYLAKVHQLGFTWAIQTNPDESQRLFDSIPDHPLVLSDSGKRFYYGEGVERDYAKAREYFERIIERYSKTSSKIEAEAVAVATGCLSKMYYRGYGVPANRDKAINLYVSGYKYALTANYHNYFHSVNVEPSRRDLIEHILTLQTHIETLQHKVTTHERDNEALRTELEYMPEGSGYNQARDEFYHLAERSS